jgi:TPR repeat protein
MYHDGEGVKQDYEKAIYYYEQAAVQDDATAQCNLGIASLLVAMGIMKNRID